MAENARNIPTPVRVWLQIYAQFNTPPSASTVFHHILGAVSGSVSPQLNAPFSTLSYHPSSFARLQFISYFNQSTALIIPVLTAFLQLKYQGADQSKSPFATRPITMRVAVSGSVVFYLAYIALLRYPPRRFAVIAHHCLVCSGYALVASLASVLFPDSFSPFIYAAFLLLSATELMNWLCRKLVGGENDAEFQVRESRGRRFLNGMWRAAANSSHEQWPQILPV